MTGRVPLITEEAKNIKEKLQLIYRGKRTSILEANPNLKNEPHLAEVSEIIEQLLALNPQDRPPVEAVQERLNTLWSQMDETQRRKIAIIYDKKWDSVGPDSLRRTTTDTLAIDGLNS
jgi:hypothetical protein